MTSTISTVLIAALLASSPAAESDTEEVGTLSQAGARRGGLELGLGGLLTATAGGLIGFGAQQFVHAREHAAYCSVYGVGEGFGPCSFDPPSLGYAAAGLSWGFSAALLAGAGLLFARGARVRADARAYDRLQVTLAPWWGGSGGGARLHLRF